MGRATSLRDRVKSYFAADLLEARGPKLVAMLVRAKKIEFRVTDSVLEAIFLEADLIKKLKPEFNTVDKDDKSFNCVIVTDEEYPRVLLVRQKDLDSKLTTNSLKLKIPSPKPKAIFGPFPAGGKLKEVLKIIRKIFPFRDDKCTPLSGRPCFNRQIGLCPGVCTGEISREDYLKNIRHIKLLFLGKKKVLIDGLKKEMKMRAKKREFEKAAVARNSIRALENINDIALINENKNLENEGIRIEAFDVAHTAGSAPVGVMVSIYRGIPDKNMYRKFRLRKTGQGDDLGALREILSRRLVHEEWGIPDAIVVDGGETHRKVALKTADLVDQKYRPVVVSVVKDERHRPKNILGDAEFIQKHEGDILLANSEAHRFALSFHRKLRDQDFRRR